MKKYLEPFKEMSFQRLISVIIIIPLFLFLLLLRHRSMHKSVPSSEFVRMSWGLGLLVYVSVRMYTYTCMYICM